MEEVPRERPASLQLRMILPLMGLTLTTRDVPLLLTVRRCILLEHLIWYVCRDGLYVVCKQPHGLIATFHGDSVYVSDSSANGRGEEGNEVLREEEGRAELFGGSF